MTPALSRRDVVAEIERRTNGGDVLPALADPLDGHVAIIEDTPQDRLVDVDALDLVQRYFEGAALDKPGLVHNPHVSDVGLGGKTMEPGLDRPIQRRDRDEGGCRQAEQD